MSTGTQLIWDNLYERETRKSTWLGRQQILTDVKPHVGDNDDDEMIMINVKRQKIKHNFKDSEQILGQQNIS